MKTLHTSFQKVPIIWRYVIHIHLIRWSLLSNIQKRGRTNHRGFGENDHIPGASGRRNSPILEKVDWFMVHWKLHVFTMSSPLRRPFHGILPLLPPASHKISGIQHLTSFTNKAHLWFRPVRGQVSLIHIHQNRHRDTTVWVRRRPPTKAARAAQMAKGMEHPYHSRSWLTIPGVGFKQGM